MDVFRSGTGNAGSNPSPRVDTNALLTPWNNPPVIAPRADSSVAFFATDAARMPMVYCLRGPHLSNALFGIESITRCHPNLCCAPNDRVGVRHQTVIAFASDSCMTFAAAKSHSSLRRSPLCAASYVIAPPIVTTCSNPSFHRNAGSAMRRPTNARLTDDGVLLLTARTMLGRTSTDMNLTSCIDDTMPISIAMRIAYGTSVSVRNHSWSTALMASRSYVSPMGDRVVRKESSPPSSSPSSK
mmetsp:Transcript_12793/g.45986  ORF Transcript_12793/g.45986 Transcript_12793/m.45986 type:complete len:242 (+) Transcript_12793:613-1338(+)